ncbi:MAG: sialate O-acetylesterase [Cyclobacteriaceae bacterium]|nr:sialate O-acetylesterase [Cyclobacteriaceae bacterium]
MRNILILLIAMSTLGCSTKTEKWVFVLAGQSNMAGRGVVEPQDTITTEGIYTLNEDMQLELAKDPLHFYEPKLKGIGPGYPFAKELKKNIPNSVEIVLVPTALGASSISQWLGDSLHRGVHLYSNFKTRLDSTKKLGDLKAILWLQGESDANPRDLPNYKMRLEELFQRFRKDAGNDQLPILVGEVGTYSEPESRNQDWKTLNGIINEVANADSNTYVISSKGLASNSDHIHYNAASQRTLGKRFASKYLNEVYQKQ